MESQLDQRSRQIFERLVDMYLETGEAVGSLALQRRNDISVSAATIRNTMADLSDCGLIAQPHTSAGRIPTMSGLNFFIDEFVQLGSLDQQMAAELDQHFNDKADVSAVVSQANDVIGQITKGITMLAVPKNEGQIITHIRFVRISDDQIMAVIVMQNDQIENRLIPAKDFQSLQSLDQISNYMTELAQGKTLAQASQLLSDNLKVLQQQLSILEGELAQQGLDVNSDPKTGMFVYKASPILENADIAEKMDDLRDVYNALEQGNAMQGMLDVTKQAAGVQVFIGAEHKLFGYQGLSTVISPIKGEDDRVLGAFAYVVPHRAQYRRVIPAVDYTARMIARLIQPK